MRFAVVSDIHANRQAWQAVAQDMDACGVDEVVCLGDIVGYGPCPAQVLEEVYSRAAYYVLGNHDAVVCRRLDATCFNDRARKIIDWTTEQLNDEAVEFFQQVPYVVTLEGICFVHATAHMPEAFGYVESVDSARESLAACSERITFVGHTHMPEIYEQRGDGQVARHRAESRRLAEPNRFLVNVGSVGDPRDGDARACYVVFDTATQALDFRRVPFDVEGYRRDIEASGLPVRPALFQALQGCQVGGVAEDFVGGRGPATPPPGSIGSGSLFQREANKVVRCSEQPVTFASARVREIKVATEEAARPRNLVPLVLALLLAGVIGVMAWQMLGRVKGQTAHTVATGVVAPSRSGVIQEGEEQDITVISRSHADSVFGGASSHAQEARPAEVEAAAEPEVDPEADPEAERAAQRALDRLLEFLGLDGVGDDIGRMERLWELQPEVAQGVRVRKAARELLAEGEGTEVVERHGDLLEALRYWGAEQAQEPLRPYRIALRLDRASVVEEEGRMWLTRQGGQPFMTLAHAPAWRPGRLGMALQFDGRQCARSEKQTGIIGRRDFSLSFWARQEAENVGGLVALGEGGEERQWVALLGGEYWKVAVGPDEWRSSKVAKSGEWQFHVVVYEAGSARLRWWVDGAEVLDLQHGLDLGDGLWLGAVPGSGPERMLRGALREVHVYARALRGNERAEVARRARELWRVTE